MEISPEWLSTFRMITAGILFLIFDIMQNRQNIFKILKKTKNLKELVIFGVFGVLGAQYTYFVTIKASNAAVATVLQYLMPIILVIWACIIERRKPGKIEMLCAMLATLGTFFIVTHGNYETLQVSPKAITWGLISALCAAVYTMQPQEILKKYRTSLVIGWGMIIGGICFLCYAITTPFVGKINTESIAAFIYTIILGTVIAFGLFLASTKYIKPQEAGIVGALEPLSSVTFSILIFSISFGIYELIGMALIISAVIFVTRQK